MLIPDEIEFLNVWLQHTITRYGFPFNEAFTERRWLAKELLMNRKSKPYIKMKMAFGHINSQRKRGTKYA